MTPTEAKVERVFWLGGERRVGIKALGQYVLALTPAHARLVAADLIRVADEVEAGKQSARV